MTYLLPIIPKAIEINPQDVNAFNNRGVDYVKEGQVPIGKLMT